MINLVPKTISKMACNSIRNRIIKKIEEDPSKFSDEYVIENYPNEYNWFINGLNSLRNLYDYDNEEDINNLIEPYLAYVDENKVSAIWCAIKCQEKIVNNIRYIYIKTLNDFVHKELIIELDRLNKLANMIGYNCEHLWLNHSFDKYGMLQEEVCDKCGLKKAAE